MVDDSDADAFGWAGDEPLDSETAGLSLTPEPEVREASTPPATPAALLVSYGILTGIYLTYVVGWVTVVQRLNAVRPPSPEVLGESMFQLGEALAIISPTLWFFAVIVLTRSRRRIVRLMWLVAGLITVAPWPYVVGAFVS